MRVLVVVLSASVIACGGDGDTTPTAPSSTTTAVSVTVPGPVRMGQTAQATGTENLSNGQTRPVTSGWQSDAPAVATVTGAGLVTGVANGRATIFVIASGRQGQQVVRVVPDYQGRWSGGLRVTSCTESGIFATADFCDESPVGATFNYLVSLSQTGEQMTAIVDYGPPLLFPSIAAPIGEDGTSTFAPSVSYSESGLTLIVDAAFNIDSKRVGEVTGTVNEVWRIPGIAGEGRLTQNIISTTRTGTTTLSGPGGDGTPRRLRVLRKLTESGR